MERMPRLQREIPLHQWWLCLVIPIDYMEQLRTVVCIGTRHFNARNAIVSNSGRD